MPSENELHRAKEAFLKYLDGIRGYSSLTIRSYHDAIDEMLLYAEIHDEADILMINLMPLRLRIAPLKSKTIAAKLSAIRSFVKYLRSQKKTVELRGDESVKTPKTLPKPVSHDHIIHALQCADPMAQLAITMLYTMGLRISELTNLRVDDISHEWCRVRGKGDKERDVPMLGNITTMVQTYQRISPSKAYVFEAKGEKLSENSLRYMITKAFAKVGLKVTPHQLRHSYATELLNNGARIADVSELLGHASMATTQIYTKLGNALKMDHYLKSHPLCHSPEDSQ
ncbi:MAG: tyrosine-type recombinase/integrase [Sulfuricurvum sp.]|uniref:tyrosine-type recombinase/integrase n=1 Tax=Sulfuricurvum sp. TaxID=2025608 RepID=UPI0026163F15|nr:tyrosine-type recombinase/integrase [Sulfuricurvum sp.]MDD2367767.1 tyrosine-type recombinase/integrase [Sulfuricurvum sp.]MDD2949304.1 tyrosine-type recombinase/integrase [Sulfuricurvum sp.]MDD5118390.1 tyrosine-type recombinase/integrase [Sulfuricurvum sp.]